MNRAARRLRWVAAVFLVGVVLSVNTRNGREPHPWVIVSMNVNFTLDPLEMSLKLQKPGTSVAACIFCGDLRVWLDNRTNTVLVSSEVLGYLLSLAAAFADDRRNRARGLWRVSWVLSWLGVIGFLNEVPRLYSLYDFRFLVSCTPALLVVNWFLNRAERRRNIRLATEKDLPGA